MLNASIKGIDLKFKTSEGVFSPKGVDKGTLAMLSVVEFQEGDKVLDLGCGYGPVGILAAKIIGKENVVMIDVNEEAINVSKENIKLNDIEGIKILQSNGFEDLDEKDFTLILSNPPYHVDFSVPKAFIEKGFNRLAVGGKMFMVTKRKEWYKNKLASVFGGAKVWEIDEYFVFMAIKKNSTYAKVKKKSKTKGKSIA